LFLRLAGSTQASGPATSNASEAFVSADDSIPNRRSAAQTAPLRAAASASARFTAAKKRGVASAASAGRECLQPKRHNQRQQGYKSALILLVAMGAVRYNKRSVRPFQFKHSFLSQLAHLVIENDANARAGENRQDSSRPASRWLSQAKYAALAVHHESRHHRATRMP
jgi:hypothetical protein